MVFHLAQRLKMTYKHIPKLGKFQYIIDTSEMIIVGKAMSRVINAFGVALAVKRVVEERTRLFASIIQENIFKMKRRKLVNHYKTDFS